MEIRLDQRLEARGQQATCCKLNAYLRQAGSFGNIKFCPSSVHNYHIFSDFVKSKGMVKVCEQYFSCYGIKAGCTCKRNVLETLQLKE
jgi:hypothetical protein